MPKAESAAVPSDRSKSSRSKTKGLKPYIRPQPNQPQAGETSILVDSVSSTFPCTLSLHEPSPPGSRYQHEFSIFALTEVPDSEAHVSDPRNSDWMHQYTWLPVHKS